MEDFLPRELRKSSMRAVMIEDLDDAALHGSSGRANSVGFNLWHVARQVDWLQPQIARTRGED
jgi:hypothetical protein